MDRGENLYGVCLGQVYVPADGSRNELTVVDTETYRYCGDVLVYDQKQDTVRRIDAFKLARVRYELRRETK